MRLSQSEQNHVYGVPPLWKLVNQKEEKRKEAATFSGSMKVHQVQRWPPFKIEVFAERQMQRRRIESQRRAINNDPPPTCLIGSDIFVDLGDPHRRRRVIWPSVSIAAVHRRWWVAPSKTVRSDADRHAPFESGPDGLLFFSFYIFIRRKVTSRFKCGLSERSFFNGGLSLIKTDSSDVSVGAKGKVFPFFLLLTRTRNCLGLSNRLSSIKETDGT